MRLLRVLPCTSRVTVHQACACTIRICCALNLLLADTVSAVGLALESAVLRLCFGQLVCHFVIPALCVCLVQLIHKGLRLAMPFAAKLHSVIILLNSVRGSVAPGASLDEPQLPRAKQNSHKKGKGPQRTQNFQQELYATQAVHSAHSVMVKAQAATHIQESTTT